MTAQVRLKGNGAVAGLMAHLKKIQSRRILFVTGRQSFDASGAADIMDRLSVLGSVDRTVRQAGLLSLSHVSACLADMSASPPDTVVAVGGGATIDLAKCASLCLTMACSPKDLFQIPACEGPLSLALIAMPTTAGSGSEATQFAVLYDDDGRKCTIDDPAVLPSVAVLCSALTESMPRDVRVASGLDAMAQAVESHWSIRSTDESRALSVESIALSMANLADSVNCGEARAGAAMLTASHLAGRAINITRTTASHAMSYPLTSRFGMLHGVAVFMTLPVLFRFNCGVDRGSCSDERGCEFVRARLQEIAVACGCDSAEAVPMALVALGESIGVSPRLTDHRIDRAEVLARLPEEVDAGRLANNPRQMSHSAIVDILEEIA